MAGGATPKPPTPEWFPPLPCGPGPAPKPAATAEIRDGVARLYLEAAIGSGAGEVGSAAVAAQLADLKARGARALLIAVDSDGGNALDGIGIFDALREFSRTSGSVVAHVVRAASAASLVALAADHVVVDPDGSFMIHGPSGGTEEQRGAVSRRMTAIYRERADLGEGEIAWRFEADSRALAPRAIEDCLADEIGTMDRAEMLAEAAASGGALPWSRRRAVLGALAALGTSGSAA
jgi:ATP-dependent protease ClpP protease subunit